MQLHKHRIPLPQDELTEPEAIMQGDGLQIAYVDA